MAMTYSGWRNERIGLLGGASILQVSGALVCTVPAWLALSNQRYVAALFWGVIAIAVAVMVFVTVHERVLYRWVTDVALFTVGKATGASQWQAGVVGDALTRDRAQELDLPGPLQRLKIHDGPPHAGSAMRRVSLVQDPSGVWVVVAGMHHPGLSLSDPGAGERYAEELGTMLSSLARAEHGVKRLSVYVRTVPDNGAERAAWHAEHALVDSSIPQSVIDSTDELEKTVLSASIEHEIYVAIAFTDDHLSKPAKAAGGGVGGRAAVIYRYLGDVETGLTACGCQGINWLSTGQIAAAIRTGYNPSEAGSLAVADALNARGTGAFDEVLPAGAGPSAAPAPNPRSYTHDAFRSVSYSLLLPDLGTQVGKLSPLLTPAMAMERRCVALHYEPLTVKEAQKQVERDSSLTTMASELKQSRGFRVGTRKKNEETKTRTQERTLAAGHTLVRVAGVVVVTVPSSYEIETNAALIEAAARRGGYSLMRLELSQEMGFVAGVLPLCIGLPKRGS